MGRTIYAGCSYQSGGENTVSGNPQLNINAGTYKVYASGSGGTTLDGDATVYVDGSASVEVVSAAYGATITGDVDLWITGEGVTFKKFLGEEITGNIQGFLGLFIDGNPILSDYILLIKQV